MPDDGGWDRYEQRDRVLRQMGFANYGEYLRSGLWRRIRARRLAVDEGRCRKCGQEATQVHHTHYHPLVLMGRKLRGLVSVCEDCHERAEFDGSRKCSPHEANSRLGTGTIPVNGVRRAYAYMKIDLERRAKKARKKSMSYRSAARNAKNSRVTTSADRRNKELGNPVGRSTIWQQDQLIALGIPRSKTAWWTALRAQKEIATRRAKAVAAQEPTA